MTLSDFEAKVGYSGNRTAEDVLGWALDRFHPRIAIASSLQDAVIIHMAARLRQDVRVFSIDTGRLPEETYCCAEEIATRFGIRIEWHFPQHGSVQKIETEQGLFSFKKSLAARRECCFVRKVEPLQRALKGLDAWVTGIRKAESVTREQIGIIQPDPAHGGIVKINPIADWSAGDVRQYIEKHKLPYNRLLDRGYPSIGCSCCTRPIQPGEDPRAGRWWWEQPQHKECGLHVPNWSI